MNTIAPDAAPSNDPDEQERLRAALPGNVRTNLEAVETVLRVSLRLRGRNGDPTLAVILDRCPLCLAGADNRDERRQLRKRSAVILLPSLRLRCDGGCIAGESRAGLSWNEWRREFRALEEITTPVPDEPGGSSDSAKDAVAKISAVGRFFEVEGATFFVTGLRAEPVRVSDRGPFPAVVAEVVGLAQRSTKLKNALPAVIDYAHRNAKRALAEFVTGRAPDGTLLVHLGAGRIARYDGRSYVPASNGDYDVVFSTESDFEPIVFAAPAAVRPMPETFPALHEAILDGIPPVVGPLTRKEAQALLLAMWLGIFLRPWATARPVILLIGPAACGKTTLQRQFAVAFYGPEGEVGGGAALDRVPKDLLAGAVFQSFVVRDDVTDLPAGGIDVMCRMATGTKVKLSTFHETLALTSYRARAQLFLSAVSPSWLSRGDLMSRILLIELTAGLANNTLTERDRVERVSKLRPSIWAETLIALTTLGRPLPPRKPITRFDSFEQAVFPIIERAGYGEAFESALRKMPAITSMIAARSEPMLGAILALAHAVEGRWLTAVSLNEQLAKVLGVEVRSLQHRDHVTPDPVRLAHLLRKIEREGSTVVQVESRGGHNHTRLWRLTARVRGGDGGLGGVAPEVTEREEQSEDQSSDPSDDAASPPTPPADLR